MKAELITTIHVERARKNITQRQLAKKLKVSMQTISEIENGQNTNLMLAFKIARFFGVQVDDIFKLAKKPYEYR